MLNQSALDHGDQIAVVVTHNESNWATAPSSTVLKLCKPSAMLPVGGIKCNPRATNVIQSTHIIPLSKRTY
jgi:hypothetical protein